ncbi:MULTISPECIES: arsenate reductase (glutaredoxin) [Salipiger]|uniref:arsenate reductase (glutaredoxin) n=1 Tax=Salipiger TaxID=263377 RepID=UPI003512DB72
MILWHNPSCSKSREALKLLEAHGVRPEIRKYLEDAPTYEELKAAQAALNLPAIEMMRTKEPAFREMGLSKDADDDTLLRAMAAEPRLIERPLAIEGARAILGRPPAKVLDLL